MSTNDQKTPRPRSLSPTTADKKPPLSPYKSDGDSSVLVNEEVKKPKLPILWRVAVIVLTCLCSFGNHWSNGLIVALKTTIISHTHINNSQFATLVAVTNLVNTFLCILLGFAIDKWGGPKLSVVLAFFHLAGSTIMAGAATNNLNSFVLLIIGKVIAAIGDSSLDNAQHRIFSTYFAPGRGFAFSIGMIWSIANLGQFVGQSTANVITRNLGSYAWSLWISAIISVFSFLCAISLVILDTYLSRRYYIKDQTNGGTHLGKAQENIFNLKALRKLSATFWIIVAFAVFENAGVQSFVSISTQFAQQRLKKGAVIGGWVSSFYLLLPVGLTPFLGVWIDAFGNRVTLLFLSGVTFLISMLLLRFSHSIQTFVAAYVFYALSQCVTPAPQVEIIRQVIPDPRYFATAFSIKKSVVQASIVIITTAAGKIQDDSGGSLDNAISLWLAYGFASVAISGTLLIAGSSWWPILPAARLAQIPARRTAAEVERLDKLGPIPSEEKGSDENLKERSYNLKVINQNRGWVSWVMLGLSIGMVLLGWVMFGLGVFWGVHGSVVVERQSAKEVLRALLHAILFHRLLGVVKPQTSEVLDVTLPAVNDPDIEHLVDDKVNVLWRAVEAGRHKKGQIILALSEKRQKKGWAVTQIFSAVEEEVPWEEWHINVDLRQALTDRDRQTLNSNLSSTLSDALKKILTHTSSERGRAAIPLITNAFNGLSPFPFSIRVRVGGIEVS
ncbi:hypothetical protein Clacol_009573 [Clathrus columnatus]|uniref:Lysosomal dipeptide transporter MFSD1 n=1 Tax=Clathrus columnatus TaxID=1419009 RepID=A0AAV5ANG1_9AGAM|nr:hypothetical protein Clacol_009573 [Clathrus columnatus]